MSLETHQIFRSLGPLSGVYGLETFRQFQLIYYALAISILSSEHWYRNGIIWVEFSCKFQVCINPMMDIVVPIRYNFADWSFVLVLVSIINHKSFQIAMPEVFLSFTCLLEQSYLTSRRVVAREIMPCYIPHTHEIFLCTRKCFVDWVCVWKKCTANRKRNRNKLTEKEGRAK